MRRNKRQRVISVVLSVAGHIGLTAGIALAPALAARNRQPIEYVEVQIVPLQALGVPEPIAPRPQPREPEESEPATVLPGTEEPARPETRPQASVPEPKPEPRRRTAEPDESSSGAIGPPDAPAQRRGSPFGSALATSPFGTAVAGFDNPDFVYGYYVEQMLAMIGSNWTRPSAAAGTEMMIHFRIHANGELSEIEIVEPSGSSAFDLAGMRAIRLANPLPPLPSSFPHDSLGVNLIIR